MYRVYNSEPTLNVESGEGSDAVGRNCEEWQKMTSMDIPLEDIHQVVYKMSLAEFEAVYDNRTAAYENKFAEWITKKDIGILDFLFLAKTNEYIRLERNSRWYYPSMKIGARMTLEEIAEKALSEKNGRLGDRYLLQGIRALFSLTKYAECIELWDAEVSRLPQDNLMRQLIHPYVAGAEFHVGHVDKAMEHFALLGDVRSMLFCVGRTGDNVSAIDALELVCEYAPNSDYIEKTLQTYIRKIEPAGDWFLYDVGCFKKTADYGRLYELCLKMARGGKSDNPAMWYYTAAFLADLDGNTSEASYLLGLAENSKSTDFIDESIEVMKIYLDAKRMAYNSSYENRLFRQLKWLDMKIQANIDDDVRYETSLGTKLITGESYYYWNDMMRRILLAEVCPRMIKAGKPVRALQLANMAENRLLNLVDEQNEYKWGGKRVVEKSYTMTAYRYSDEENRFDYRNHFFEMIDSLGVNTAVKYAQRVNNPQNEFDRFLNSRSYVGSDYLNDIIGTQYLRNMQYGEALKYLGAVSEAYKNHLNVRMLYDPFTVDAETIGKGTDFRYDFAREMHSLEQTVSMTTDPNKKAQLLVKYAIGIRNSFDRCWALTQYYRGYSFWGRVCEKRDWESGKCVDAAMDKVEELTNLAFGMMTDDELAANIQYMMGNFKTVAIKYPDTAKGELVRGQCDNLYDYHEEICRHRWYRY